MEVNTLMQNPLIIGTLSNLIASLICKIGNSFSKRPREKGLAVEVENFLVDLNVNSEVNTVLIDFLSKFEVQNYFFTYVKYRTIKLEGETNNRKITKEEFVTILTTISNEYVNKNCTLTCGEEKIRCFFNEILRQVEEKIISKIPENQTYLFNILTNIELLYNAPIR